MAYAAAVTVTQILDQLLNTDRYDYIHYPKPQIENLHNMVSSLLSSFDKLYSVPKSKLGEVGELESKMRDVMYRAQDTIELFMSRKTTASLLVQDLVKVMGDLHYIIKCAEEILLAKDGMPKLSSVSSSVKKSTRIVGMEENRIWLKGVLLDSEKSLQVIPITGVGGIGKTTLARTVYDDPDVKEYFTFRAWITVSRDSNKEEILSNVMSSYHERYLIVIDDIWDQSLLDQVLDSFPDNQDGSRIVITSRDEKFARYSPSNHLMMHILGGDDSWALLSKCAFGGRDCPPDLENIGRNIAAKCGFLPLSIVLVGGLLSQGPETEQYWISIEAAIDGSKIIQLCYNYLPSRLKPCFLYMAAFPEDSEILVSKLANLWVAEGFLTHPSPSSPPQTLEQIAKQHLVDLIDRKLVVVSKMSYDGQPKTCMMHDLLLQFALEECRKESFFHAVMKRNTRGPLQGTETQRRVSIHSNSLLSCEDVHKCTEAIEFARTLVYADPNLYHPLPHFLSFELLRVLDALSIYFLELPNALFELVHLRYLSLTYDEDLPHSICKLQNLLILIVCQHPKTIFRRKSVLPTAVWNLPQIRQLLFTDCFLPNPSDAQNTLLFENLQSLSNVNVACCTQEILRNMPNLKKLCTWIERPGGIQFDLDHLKHIETFKFFVLKPIPGLKIDFQPKLAFPNTLRKLSLSGCGLPWEDMTVIEELSHLQVLKLRELAFEGPKWCPNGNGFEQLKFLLLESLDLEILDADDSHLRRLERLVIRHCYQLEKINTGIGCIGSLKLIKLVNCSPDAVASVESIRYKQQELGNEGLQVHISSSWE